MKVFQGLFAAGLVWVLCSCSSGSSSGVKLVAKVSNLTVASSSVLADRAVRRAWAAESQSLNITPTVYKLALVNFWLINEGGTDVNVLTRSEDNPLIIDFSAPDTSQELVSTSTFEAGTYTGYKMQFLYIEMRLPVSFHTPHIEEADYPAYASLVDTTVNRDFRLYFNAIGKYWKRDFVAELDADSDEWYWLRRGVEDSPGVKNFFIAVASNDHPSGNSGPQSTIDLFDAPEFWGDAADYSSNASPIIVGTHTTAGGVNATLAEGFTIPSTLDGLYTMTLTVNVQNTMNYGLSSDPAPGTQTEDVLDLGPSYGQPIYGDAGLHPMLPVFTFSVEK